MPPKCFICFSSLQQCDWALVLSDYRPTDTSVSLAYVMRLLFTRSLKAYGFRFCRSTADILTDITQRIRELLDNKSITKTVPLDIRVILPMYITKSCYTNSSAMEFLEESSCLSYPSHRVCPWRSLLMTCPYRRSPQSYNFSVIYQTSTSGHSHDNSK